jgi:parallel beta-helix repeat protein
MARSSKTMQRWAWVLGGLAMVAAGCGDDGGNGSGETGPEGSSGTEGGSSDTAAAMLPDGCDAFVSPGADDQTAVQEALIDATTGQTVCLDAGTFTFTRQLTLDADGVTVRGQGGDMTILDFSGQISGANGMLITGNGITIADTPGGAFRGDKIDDIAFEGVHVVWPDVASLDNGAYGLYPVQSNGVTIRDCLVDGARDAGVYVGQSTAILVENNEARGNVAGIEIENSTDAIVRGNHAHDNTAGILVFNLPGLDIGDGQRTNVYDNDIENNNVPNFGEPGTVVSMVPPGIGVLLLAADRNEIADNRISGNDSVGIVVLLYSDMLFPPPEDAEFDIYAEGNFIHDNVFEGNGQNPADLILLVTENAMPTPDIMFDGCADPEKDNADGSLSNCLAGTGDATFMAVNLCGQGMLETEPTSYTCEHDPLPREL